MSHPRRPDHDELVARLRDLALRQPPLSIAEMARRLRVSRNVVSGLRFRHGLTRPTCRVLPLRGGAAAARVAHNHQVAGASPAPASDTID